MPPRVGTSSDRSVLVTLTGWDCNVIFRVRRRVTNVRDLILLCRDVATRHVEHFNRLIITDEI